MAPARWTVGIDFGGTNIKVGLVRDGGRLVRTQVLRSSQACPPAAFVEQVGETAEALARSVGVRPRRFRGIGVGAPGPVDVERGVVHSLVNVRGWRRVPLGTLLERRLGCRCVVDNDVNLFTLGEARYGAGRGARSLVGLTLGTGVGGGLMFHGALYRGTAGAAGEIGHMVIDPRGHRCACGSRGCLEAHIGTAAILRMARRYPSPELVSQAAARGDAAARKVWAAVGRSLGVGLANVVNLLNPDRIVIGGGVSNAWRWFAPTVRATLRAQAMAVSARSARIVRARLGDHAGILGAAVLVWERPR